jgi:hypothetical protein
MTSLTGHRVVVREERSADLPVEYEAFGDVLQKRTSIDEDGSVLFRCTTCLCRRPLLTEPSSQLFAGQLMLTPTQMVHAVLSPIRNVLRDEYSPGLHKFLIEWCTKRKR